MINFLKNTVKIFRMFESALLVFFLSLLIIISFSQIILRIFSSSIPWFESVLKYCVLWAGVIAAQIATYENKHIKIDIIGRFTKGRTKIILSVITNLFAFAVCLLISVLFVIYIATIEYTSTEEPPFLNIKKWVLLLILPAGFFIMSVRFLIHTIKNIRKAVSYNGEDEPAEMPVNGDKR